MRLCRTYQYRWPLQGRVKATSRPAKGLGKVRQRFEKPRLSSQKIAGPAAPKRLAREAGRELGRGRAFGTERLARGACPLNDPARSGGGPDRVLHWEVWRVLYEKYLRLPQRTLKAGSADEKCLLQRAETRPGTQRRPPARRDAPRHAETLAGAAESAGRAPSVVVKAAGALATERAFADQRAHARGDALADRLADRRCDVEADEIEQRERAHRVARAELHARVHG